MNQILETSNKNKSTADINLTVATIVKHEMEKIYNNESTIAKIKEIVK